MDFTKYKVLTFDCYGTLVDWESGISRFLKPIVSKSNLPITRDELLEKHAIAEAHLQSTNPSLLYPKLLGNVYSNVAKQLKVQVTQKECDTYGNSVGKWPAFEDSSESLKILKKYFKLAILSNVDNQSFEESKIKLDIDFDFIFTAEMIGSYKPDLRNFHYALGELAKNGIKSCEILHVAESVFHDHIPADQLGIDKCRIYRRSKQTGYGATKVPKRVPQVEMQFENMLNFSAEVENYFHKNQR